MRMWLCVWLLTEMEDLHVVLRLGVPNGATDIAKVRVALGNIVKECSGWKAWVAMV